MYLCVSFYSKTNCTLELAVHLRLSLNSYRLPSCSPLFTKGFSYLVVHQGALISGCIIYCHIWLVYYVILAEDVQTTFSTCPAVEVAAAVTGTITLVIGVLAGVLTGGFLFYCISKYRFQSSKPFSHQQQLATVPQQRAGPEYEEVVELKENVAYGPAQSIELKACEAYVPVQR